MRRYASSVCGRICDTSTESDSCFIYNEQEQVSSVEGSALCASVCVCVKSADKCATPHKRLQG